MIKIPFFKYQGAGNDFVIIDQRKEQYLDRADQQSIALLCDRRFGIGGDGLMLLENKAGFDFEMIYFNSDGAEGSMCGNGGRCIVAFAQALGVIGDSCTFWAVDGLHEAKITREHWVELKMQNVESIEQGQDHFFLDTGSPHYVSFVSDLEEVDVVKKGRGIRYSDRFKAEGVNVNFVEKTDTGLKIATYERGVEDETLACGTGVTAAALAYHLQTDRSEAEKIPVVAKGGDLEVRFEHQDGQFSNIWLCGPAKQVFSGAVTI